MNIALDAMGGDNAPEEIVAGAVQASPNIRGTITLVGDLTRIKSCLPVPSPKNITVHPATEVIEMSDKPIEALRKKRDSSLVVAAELVKSGVADAMVSAGNTGAAAAGCLLSWRQIPGFHRPAIATTMPSRTGSFLLLDAGASPDVDAEHLVEFGLMARAYASKAMGRENPGVHLLNIGEEEGKGNKLAQQAFKLLSKYDWFRGNIEGKEMFDKEVDIVVCDAFVGNVVLKTCEGVAELLLRMVRQEMPKSKIAQIPFLPVRKLFAPLKRKMDYAEYGGSPLLGLNGLCIICHGRSNAKAICNALLQAQRGVENGVVESLRLSAKTRS